jgi:acetolactate synthase-1/2/3 large subunit
MKLTGAQIIIRELLHAGANEVFGYPGGSVLDIYDELYKSRDAIRHYIFAHEQGAAHAADGYARATGKTGVVVATSGPGATNLVTGIATAYLDSVPLVAITGNVATDFIGRDSFQEVNIVGITMPVTKHNYIVSDVNELQKIFREAFYLVAEGRPGPVLIDIPKDVQKDFAEYNENFESGELEKYKADFDLGGAVALIEGAKKPCVYAGGGVVISDASKELIEFAKMIDAPIAASLMGLTAVPCGYDSFLGMAGMHGKYAASRAFAECDLLIAVGTRFSDRATGNKRKFSDGRKFLQFDIDRAEINKNIKIDAFVVGDIKKILAAMINSGIKVDNKKWLEYTKKLKTCAENNIDAFKGALTPKFVIESAKRIFGGDVVVATDVGQHQMWTAQYFGFENPRGLMTGGGLGTMGYGMGAAIGAAIGSGRRALLFTGDGSFHMNLNELATAVSHNIPLTVILMDNNALGMVRQWQTMFYDGRYSETTLDRKTDYVKLAEAFGAVGLRAKNKEELTSALNRAEKLRSPCLVHCVIDSDENVFPMIPPNGEIGDIILR